MRFFLITFVLPLLFIGYTSSKEIFHGDENEIDEINLLLNDGRKENFVEVKRKNSPSKAPIGKKKAKKEGDGIKKPTSAYIYFVSDCRMVLKKKGVETNKVEEVAKLCGAAWKRMTDEQKKPYNEKYKADRARYEKERESLDKRIGKDLNKPKRPQTAYFFFLNDFRKEMAGKSLPQGEKIPSLAGKIWRTMTPEQKKIYEVMAEKDKIRYDKEMEEWKKTKTMEKDQMKPKRPLKPYVIFFRTLIVCIARPQNESNFSYGYKIWNAKTAEEKKIYEEMAEKDKIRYEKKLKEWKEAKTMEKNQMKPKRPLKPYVIFFRTEIVCKAKPQGEDIFSFGYKVWNAKTTEEKKIYEVMAEKDKIRYDKEIEEWKKTHPMNEIEVE